MGLKDKFSIKGKFVKRGELERGIYCKCLQIQSLLFMLSKQFLEKKKTNLNFKTDWFCFGTNHLFLNTKKALEIFIVKLF
jgi:hypothetical protein